jgi:peroxiredoxin
MCSSAAHHADLPRQPDPCASFVADAQANLAIVRAVFGPQSRRYTGLVERYLVTADALGCQEAIKHVLVSLAPPPTP